jgi:Uma2 family endonuclease
MSVADSRKRLTAEDLWNLGPGSESFELDEGELVEMVPAGPRHGRITMRLGRRIDELVERHRLGIVFAAETGFTLAEDTVRGPDVSFVRTERIPAEGLPERGFFPGAPDLAVEVLSPGDWGRPGALSRRIGQFLAAGTRLVWVVDLRQRHVVVHRPDNTVEIVPEQGVLTAEPVLPGFELPLAELFD